VVGVGFEAGAGVTATLVAPATGVTGDATGGVVVGVAAVVGYVADGAEAIVAAEVAGTVETGGATSLAGLATDLADGGADWAVRDWGVPCVEGSTGGAGSAGATPSADRATSELSVAGASFFHHASFCGIWAQRGPD
jgi:hypothetical protein